MRSSWIRVGLRTSGPRRKESKRTQGEVHVKAEAEIGLMCIEYKEYQGLPAIPEAGRRMKGSLLDS